MSGSGLCCLCLFRVNHCFFWGNVRCLYGYYHQIGSLSFASTKKGNWTSQKQYHRNEGQKRLACLLSQSVDFLYRYFGVLLRNLIALRSRMRELQIRGQLPTRRAYHPGPCQRRQKKLQISKGKHKSTYFLRSFSPVVPAFPTASSRSDFSFSFLRRSFSSRIACNLAFFRSNSNFRSLISFFFLAISDGSRIAAYFKQEKDEKICHTMFEYSSTEEKSI